MSDKKTVTLEHLEMTKNYIDRKGDEIGTGIDAKIREMVDALIDNVPEIYDTPEIGGYILMMDSTDGGQMKKIKVENLFSGQPVVIPVLSSDPVSPQNGETWIKQ